MRAIEIYSYGGLASTISQSSSISKNKKAAHRKYNVFIYVCMFVQSVLPPDVLLRKACGGQKLRDIMLDANVELYGPYARPLLNCGGGRTCATCMVEVVEGKELLNPRTDKENENLKWNRRLACQATVGKPDSRGMMVIQQLPEWKAHEWNYRGLPPIEEEEESISSSSA
ncbi:unnamed protein product [Withania somnifera]